MKEYANHFLSFLIFKLGPDFFIIGTMALIAIYWDNDLTGSGPIWKNLAFGAMSIAGSIGAIAFKMFMTRMKKVEDGIAREIEKRDNQHRMNTRALASMMDALRTGDKSQLNPKDLFEE